MFKYHEYKSLRQVRILRRWQTEKFPQYVVGCVQKGIRPKALRKGGHVIISTPFSSMANDIRSNDEEPDQMRLLKS
jgi:hypothetical protein